MPGKTPLTERQLVAAIRRLNSKIATRAAALATLRGWRKKRRDRLANIRAPHGHQEWMPGAKRLEREGTPWQIDCKPRGLLHTTESYGNATATLDAKRAWPHFEVGRDGSKIQYLPLSTGGRALEHPSGTVPTNGAHCFQIEVDAKASEPNWPDAQKRAVREVMRFIEDNTGVKREATVTFTDSAHVKRMTEAEWLAYQGWCGHQHAPGQPGGHWDPGQIDIKELL